MRGPPSCLPFFPDGSNRRLSETIRWGALLEEFNFCSCKHHRVLHRLLPRPGPSLPFFGQINHPTVLQYIHWCARLATEFPRSSRCAT